MLGVVPQLRDFPFRGDQIVPTCDLTTSSPLACPWQPHHSNGHDDKYNDFVLAELGFLAEPSTATFPGL
jgi:hypothetical protein